MTCLGATQLGEQKEEMEDLINTRLRADFEQKTFDEECRRVEDQLAKGMKALAALKGLNDDASLQASGLPVGHLAEAFLCED
jgi:hypothetical protein